MPHFVSKTNTPEKDKDTWQTPKAIFNALDNEFLFDFDACADKVNALCVNYFSQENSALEINWSGCGVSFFMNPPYSKTALFLERAAQQAKEHNITVVALVNANTDTKWFSEAAKTANEIRLITGRISFIKPDGTTGKGQNSKGQCLIIWRGNCQTPCTISMVSKKGLEQQRTE